MYVYIYLRGNRRARGARPHIRRRHYFQVDNIAARAVRNDRPPSQFWSRRRWRRATSGRTNAVVYVKIGRMSRVGHDSIIKIKPATSIDLGLSCSYNIDVRTFKNLL